MRLLGILLIGAGLAIALWAMFITQVAVPTDGLYSKKEFVINTGLVADRELAFLFGAFMAVIGAIFCAAANIIEAIRPTPEKPIQPKHRSEPRPLRAPPPAPVTVEPEAETENTPSKSQ